MTSPFDQSRYQVRFEWGVAGLAALAPADVVIVVDVLGFSSSGTSRAEADGGVPRDGTDAADAASADATAIATYAARLDPAPLVLLGSLRNAAEVARAILAEQTRRGARTSIAVIAAGTIAGAIADTEPAAPEAGVVAPPLRFAVEDLLGAGAVIDALGARGIDHTSPEAAAACEAFRGLRGAVRHLLTASGSGQELIERGGRDEVLAAAELDAEASVPVLRDGAFVAYAG